MLTKINLSDINFIDRPYGKLYRLVCKDEKFQKLQVNIIVIEPSQRTSKHSHPQEEIWFILEGKGRVVGENITFDITEGEAVLVPSDEIHQLENVASDTKLTYLVAMGPPRISSTVTYYPNNIQ